MSNIIDMLESGKATPSGYKYSHTDIDSLGSSEYTLVTAAFDTSGSVGSFIDPIRKLVGEVVKSLSASPRAASLMFRLLQFDDSVREAHGFKELASCNPADYDNTLQIGGMTALIDATVNALEVTDDYAAKLMQKFYKSNAIVFVITDGWDNASKYTADRIKTRLNDIKANENLESILTILIGVNMNSSSITSKLNDLKNRAGFDAFMPLEDASSDTLKKIAGFITSQSLSQSSSLGTGGASQVLTL